MTYVVSKTLHNVKVLNPSLPSEKQTHRNMIWNYTV